jgi:4-hydroxybenzoate polyprenyltransferase
MPAGSDTALSKARPSDYAFLMRPAALVPLWIFYFAGFGLAAARSSMPGFPPFRLTLDAALGCIALTATLAGGYVINQISDRESDRANRKLYLLADGIVPVRNAWIALAVLWSLATALSALLPAEFAVATAGSALLCVTYSLPPVHAKAGFPLDLVWNGVGFGVLAPIAGWAVVGRPGPGLVGPVVCYGAAVAGIIASTTIPDREGDSAAGHRTAAVALGDRRTSALALALVASAAAVGVATRDAPGALGALLSLPLLARAHRTGSREHRVAANQWAVAAFAAGVALRSVYPLALLAAAALASRSYYRRRFRLQYPGPGTP